MVMAFSDLRRAYETDVAPILAMARYELGGAIDPIDVYRTCEWRPRKAQERGRALERGGDRVIAVRRVMAGELAAWRVRAMHARHSA